MKLKSRIGVLVASVTLLASSAAAQSAPTPTGLPATDYRAEFIKDLDARAQKYISLAELIPADKFTWRPDSGVRSFAEVFMHISAANFNLPRLIGKAPPAGFAVQTFEKSTTQKAEIVRHLRASFAHIREAAIAAPANADATQPFLGSPTSNKALMQFMTGHLGEHLGQLIAYSRVNKIKPPWSEG